MSRPPAPGVRPRAPGPIPSGATPLRRTASHLAGWLADRRVPVPLRRPLYALWARATGSDLDEVQLPLSAYPSLGAFFVRRLRDGVRPLPSDPAALASPVDARVQARAPVEAGELLQAKGRPYPVRELLCGVGEDVELEGGWAWTLYLAPRDYHRIHAPFAGELTEVRWFPGTHYSVNPRVLARRARVLSINERAALRLETAAGPLLLVLVGALNVGRVRVVGVDRSAAGRLEPSRRLERGEELGRFELGSTVVLIAPPGVARPLDRGVEGSHVTLGTPLAELELPAASASTDAPARSSRRSP